MSREFKLGNAILVQSVTEIEGNRVLMNPISQIWVSTDHRHSIESGELKYIDVDIPPLSAVLSITGGDPGEHVLTSSITFPWPEADLQATENHRLICEPNEWVTDFYIHSLFGLRVKFRGNGIYNFKFLVDGSPIGSLPLFLHWKDDASYAANPVAPGQ